MTTASPVRRANASDVVVTIVANDVGPIGGMELQLTQLVEGLLDRGATVTLVSRSCHLSPRQGFTWVRVFGPARPFLVAYPWFWLAGSLLTRVRKRGLLQTTGAVVANRADISTVHFVHHSQQEPSSREANVLRRTYFKAGRWISRRAEQWVYRPVVTDCLIAVSDGTARELAQFGLGRGCTLHVIPHGLDRLRFRPDRVLRHDVRAKLGLSETDLVATFVGGDWDRKGLRFAVGALAEAPGWRLIVAGRGSKAAVARWAAEAGVIDRVHYAGETEKPEEIYAAGDAFVMPSAYETYGLAVHEAAACGLPLLACRTNGVDEVLCDGANGWFVTRDPSDIAFRLRQLGADRSRLREMGEESCRRAAVPDWAAVVDGYVHIYRNIRQSATASG